MASTLPVFGSLLIDNLLLTVIVPILPEVLREPPPAGTPHLSLKQLTHLAILDENARLGLLFSTKALVQLIVNPFVGQLTTQVGYKIPLLTGNLLLIFCSLVFGFGENYWILMIGRSIHGIASSLIAVSGMAFIAALHPQDEERTKELGRTMGGAALGVLIGYPFGSLLYAFISKLAPFITIVLLCLINIFVGIRRMSPARECGPVDGRICHLFRNTYVSAIAILILVSTLSIAVLEPTLPLWLIDTIDPPNWQLGLVFIPDSLGYFLATSFFGSFALKFGRWRTSGIAVLTISLASFLLPSAGSLQQLVFPHLGLGLGLGTVDACLMPLLAKVADEEEGAGYGAVYAIAQTSVSLAYSLGPLVGGEVVGQFGFPALIRGVGLLNLCLAPMAFFMGKEILFEEQPLVHYSPLQ